jgi:hypothetical protein
MLGLPNLNATILGTGKGLDKISASSHSDAKDLQNKSVSFVALSEEEVCSEINLSNCGLALSAMEGMMRASTEYLLCGRPVVSTCSAGGRDIYYNSENCKIVADDPEAVMQGVKFWLDNPPDRKMIRRKVISQINGYRYLYCRKISQLQQKKVGYSDLPERMFYDLFLNSQSLSRRYHSPDSQITRKRLSNSLLYPETEILLKESSSFRDQPGEKGFAIENGHHKIRLDELSAWILHQLNGVKTVSEIINELASVYGNREKISDDVRDTLAQFIELDIVTIINQVK